MPGHLQDELAIPALEKELAGWQAAHGQPAQYEGARAKTEVLSSLFAIHPHLFDAFHLADALLGDGQLGVGPVEP